MIRSAGVARGKGLVEPESASRWVQRGGDCGSDPATWGSVAGRSFQLGACQFSTPMAVRLRRAPGILPTGAPHEAMDQRHS
jgi:hypothetical protein